MSEHPAPGTLVSGDHSMQHLIVCEGCNSRSGQTDGRQCQSNPSPPSRYTDNAVFPTANFITQQDIGGEHTDFINDAELRNAPDTDGVAPRWRRAHSAAHRSRLRPCRETAVYSS